MPPVQQSVEMKRGPKCILEGKLLELLQLLVLRRADPIFFKTKQYVQTRTLTPENAAFLSAVVFSLQLHC